MHHLPHQFPQHLPITSSTTHSHTSSSSLTTTSTITTSLKAPTTTTTKSSITTNLHLDLHYHHLNHHPKYHHSQSTTPTRENQLHFCRPADQESEISRLLMTPCPCDLGKLPCEKISSTLDIVQRGGGVSKLNPKLLRTFLKAFFSFSLDIFQ